VIRPKDINFPKRTHTFRTSDKHFTRLTPKRLFADSARPLLLCTQQLLFAQKPVTHRSDFLQTRRETAVTQKRSVRWVVVCGVELHQLLMRELRDDGRLSAGVVVIRGGGKQMLLHNDTAQ
jgi:hypothetical protein